MTIFSSIGHRIHKGLFNTLKVFPPAYRLGRAIERKLHRLFAIIPFKNVVILACSAGVFAIALFVFWISTFNLPKLDAFELRKVEQSTKIYDRTGNVLLYDVHQNIRRTSIPFEQMSPFIKKATVAIEDRDFYKHNGIKPTAILRAIFANILSLGYSQGGSTITQQVIKNALLTREKTITRKIKEWVLALRLEKIMTKEQILKNYLNEIPYGGSIYGIEEASQSFFAKRAQDLTLAEAAYLASLPQAPTYFSPYGKHVKELDSRKNTVLNNMLELGDITKEQYTQAKAEKVVFQDKEERNIKAPHFVMYVKQQLEEKYGEDVVQEGGLKVITTLDYNLQQKAEDTAKKWGAINEKKFRAENDGIVAVEAKTGQILVMVGSRDYFDPAIQGNYNIATAKRQPGSSFKPFVYSEAFIKGYTPETVVFDLPTEFSTSCASGGSCYNPENYDGKFRGPVTLRSALAQSLNVPAVKTLYLAGIRDSLNLAKDMGITTLTNANQYGLTLVLGGGEVTLLDMTGAYSVFANTGEKNPPTGILSVTDREGKKIEEFTPKPIRVLDENIALQITDILSDNNARQPAYSPNSPLTFPGYDVAAKTGTTNDYRDTWIMGYTSSVAVGAWAGNNDNSSMEKQVAGYIVAPMWHEFMEEVLKAYPADEFLSPAPVDPTLKPILRGIWQGGETYKIDTVTGARATASTPPELTQEKAVNNVHSILYWVDRSDPRGPAPSNPSSDSQFNLWEGPVRAWALQNGYGDQSGAVIPTGTDTIHNTGNKPQISITSPSEGSSFSSSDLVQINTLTQSTFPITRGDIFFNGVLIGSLSGNSFSFIPKNAGNVLSDNEIRVVVYDSVLNKGEATLHIKIN